MSIYFNNKNYFINQMSADELDDLFNLIESKIGNPSIIKSEITEDNATALQKFIIKAKNWKNYNA